MARTPGPGVPASKRGQSRASLPRSGRSEPGTVLSLIYNLSELLTKARVWLSGDQEFTLIVPCPP